MSCGGPLSSPQQEQEQEQELEQELEQEQEEEQELEQEELKFGAQVEVHWTRTLVNAEAFLCGCQRTSPPGL